jgi:hypothetical protein
MHTECLHILVQHGCCVRSVTHTPHHSTLDESCLERSLHILQNIPKNIQERYLVTVGRVLLLHGSISEVHKWVS